jgi:hypothetical protein
VNPLKFDPILDAASPFSMFSLQKYSKDRVVDSQVVFDTFTYSSRFLKDKQSDEATFEETITFNEKDKKYREHRHQLYMPSVESMLEIIQSSGFSRHEMVDMLPAGYEYQYLVFFTK